MRFDRLLFTISLKPAALTRTQLMLRWPRNLAQFEFSLSSAGYLTLMQSFSVTSENVTINHIEAYCRELNSVGYIFVADSMGLTSTTMM